MMPFPYQVGQAGVTQKQWSPAISMDFEGSNGGSTFTDDSRFGTTWTRSSANVTTSNTVAQKGATSLLVNGSSEYLEASTTTDIILPATTDWELRFLYNMAGGAGRYILSCIDSTPSAAGSQFGIYCSTAGGSGNNSNVISMFISDGSSYSPRIQTAAVVTQNQTHSIVIGREGSKMYLILDGSLNNTATFTGSINQVTGRKVRVGKPESTGDLGPNAMYFDDFRFFR